MLSGPGAGCSVGGGFSVAESWSASSKAGRAWCQGASELRGRAGPADRPSPDWSAGVAGASGVAGVAGVAGAWRWDAEPSPALRALRGDAGSGAGAGAGSDVGAASAPSAGATPAVGAGAWAVSEAGEGAGAGADAAAAPVAGESVRRWVAEPSLTLRARRAVGRASAAAPPPSVDAAPPSCTPPDAAAPACAPPDPAPAACAPPEAAPRGCAPVGAAPSAAAPGAAAWLAEPSPAVRARRTGRSPAARAVPRAGRAGAGGSWPLRGPHSLGSGTPGGSIWRRFGPPCSDSPGSFAPGQALTTRAARTKSLRRGWPSKPSGRRSGSRPGWPSKVTPNISWVSRSCQAAPA